MLCRSPHYHLNSLDEERDEVGSSVCGSTSGLLEKVFMPVSCVGLWICSASRRTASPVYPLEARTCEPQEHLLWQLLPTYPLAQQEGRHQIWMMLKIYENLSFLHLTANSYLISNQWLASFPLVSRPVLTGLRLRGPRVAAPQLHVALRLCPEPERAPSAVLSRFLSCNIKWSKEANG